MNNYQSLQNPMNRWAHRSKCRTIDPNTGERIRPMTELENYNMQQQSSWTKCW